MKVGCSMNRSADGSSSPGLVWFRDNILHLAKKYPGMHVAIYNRLTGGIAEANLDFDALSRWAKLARGYQEDVILCYIPRASAMPAESVSGIALQDERQELNGFQAFNWQMIEWINKLAGFIGRWFRTFSGNLRLFEDVATDKVGQFFGTILYPVARPLVKISWSSWRKGDFSGARAGFLAWPVVKLVRFARKFLLGAGDERRK